MHQANANAALDENAFSSEFASTFIIPATGDRPSSSPLDTVCGAQAMLRVSWPIAE